MIKYKLICRDCETTFDSWFSSSIEYEKLRKKNFLNCHICNSLNIEKSLMSPSVFKSIISNRNNEKNKNHQEVKKTILEYQKFIKNNFDYVGENFAYEARTIHYKNKKTLKGIYGTATKEDLRELKEEGIEAVRIPWIKNKTN